MLKFEQTCKRIAFILMGLAMLCQPSFGKVKVTKKVSSTGLNHLSIFGKGGASYHLFTQGYYTLITADANGKTHVYVNDNPNSKVYPSQTSTYEVDLSDFPEIDWSDVAIYGGKDGNDSICDRQPHIKMMGGQVGQIYLGGRGSNNKVTNTAYLYVHGGTVEYIGASSSSDFCTFSAYEYLYLENLNYTGYTKIGLDGNENKTRILVAPSCRFFFENARLTGSDVENLRGAIIETSEGVVEAYGVAQLNSDYSVDCNTFNDHSTSLTINGKLNIRKCGGWNSTKDVKNFSMVTIPAHQHEEYYLYHATCTQDAVYVSQCSVCGKDLPTTLTLTKALGHNMVTDPAVEATCWHTGLTQGKHCIYCGYVETPHTVVDKTAHNYEILYTWSSADGYNKTWPTCVRLRKSSAGKKITSAHVYQCKTCGYKNSSNVTISHSSNASYTSKNLGTATCIVPGRSYEKCFVSSYKYKCRT